MGLLENYSYDFLYYRRFNTTVLNIAMWPLENGSLKFLTELLMASLQYLAAGKNDLPRWLKCISRFSELLFILFGHEAACVNTGRS